MGSTATRRPFLLSVRISRWPTPKARHQAATHPGRTKSVAPTRLANSSHSPTSGSIDRKVDWTGISDSAVPGRARSADRGGDSRFRPATSISLPSAAIEMSSGFSGPTVYAGRDIGLLWLDPILSANPGGMHREDPGIEEREFRESNSWETLKGG